MLLNMLINMTFIINITVFNYIGTVLSRKSKPGPSISLKRLHTCQCQPRVWHFGDFIFTVFKNTSHWQKLSGKHSLYWHWVIFAHTAFLVCGTVSGETREALLGQHKRNVCQGVHSPALPGSCSWFLSTCKQGLHQAVLMGSYSPFSWPLFTPVKTPPWFSLGRFTVIARYWHTFPAFGF